MTYQEILDAIATKNAIARAEGLIESGKTVAQAEVVALFDSEKAIGAQPTKKAKVTP